MAEPPWMFVSAFIDPAVQDEFSVWHRDVHLPRVLSIPGIVSGRRLTTPPESPSYAALYIFENDAALRSALASPQAQQAREDWQRWSDRIRDFSVQFYTEATPSRSIFRRN